MGLLVELLVDLVLQFVLEVLGEGVLDVLRTRTGRLVASAVAGLVGGATWGAILANRGLETMPRTVWVALALAFGSLLASVALRGSVAEGDDATRAFPGGLLPWRWGPHQWERMALLNVLVAAGVVAGFTSQ